jgi:hypothetical protein
VTVRFQLTVGQNGAMTDNVDPATGEIAHRDDKRPADPRMAEVLLLVTGAVVGLVIAANVGLGIALAVAVLVGTVLRRR